MKAFSNAVRDEIKHIQSKVDSVTKMNAEGSRFISISHAKFLTMVDAKVCHTVVSTTSTNKCHISEVTSKDFKDLARYILAYNFIRKT